MDELKHMVIYVDNSCEVHFNSTDNSRIYLSPCGSEFVYRTYSSDNTIQSSIKYRTAYSISLFANKLNLILEKRNKYCCDRPFISPILAESSGISQWVTSQNITEAKWSINRKAFEPKSPIENDYHSFCFVWKSDCKRAEFRLSFNKQIGVVKYPVKIPAYQNDEYEQKLGSTSSSKYLHKYVFIEQEFSANHLPTLWQELYDSFSQILENKTPDDQIVCVKLPEAMPLSCNSTHLHRFDLEMQTNEPKMIFQNQTWYKTKSIEIKCPYVQNDAPNSLHKEAKDFELDSTQDYLISDTSSGRYYTCYTLNRRNGEVSETKLLVENIPSFKTHVKQVLSYANIYLKRVDSIKHFSSNTSCYTLRKLDEIDPNSLQKLHLNNAPNIPIESLTSKNQSVDKSSRCSLSPQNHFLNQSSIKSQNFAENIGHFKYLRDGKILINFVDKTRLYFDEKSLDLYLENQAEKAYCFIYLSDNSEYEICLNEINNMSNFFSKYLGFLDQWIKWLQKSSTIKSKLDNQATKTEQIEQKLDKKTLQSHLNKLKYFNYAIEQNSTGLANDSAAAISQDKSSKSNEVSFLSINNLLRENNTFLKEIAK